MTTKHIDILNIGLILLSLLLAYKLPFELFLFSYAVLGPLHYLTELNWLEGKNYFIRERLWLWVFVVLACGIALPMILSMPFFTSAVASGGVLQTMSSALYNWTDEMFLVALFFALSLVLFKQRIHITIALFASIGISVCCTHFLSFTTILAGVFLPTILHVYVFTLLFMIFGTLNSKSKAGTVSYMLMILCPFIIFSLDIQPSEYQLTESIMTSFMASNFSSVSYYFSDFFGLAERNKFFLLSPSAIKIQIFIAFCYTYHYLNWFSKTSVIGWNKNTSKAKFTVIGVLWAGSVCLYWYDYKLGFAALSLLSMLHVVLEFPLNVTSLKSIISAVGLLPQLRK